MSKNNKIIVDGNTACAKIAYAMSDMAIIYPITPSSPMAETIDELKTKNVKNVFGNLVSITEMQSEAGAAGALHGALSGGSLATTFTSSQGLLLMIPNMHKIAGELLPCVIHVAARTIATHALSIFGDHSDVMSVRNTGFAMLCASSVQEAQDFALTSHLSTIESRIPFVHFFDGFRTSHEINTIEEIDNDTIKKLTNFGFVNSYRATALSSDSPSQRGTAQNPDVFFQNREACNQFFDAVPEIVQNNFDAISKETGRKYKLFEYVGARDATDIIIAMGSACETIEETIKFLNNQGKKLGLLKVRLFRPFSEKHFLASIPKSVKNICVLDRTKESGSFGEPLFLDVVSVLAQNGNKAKIIGGRYGLSSKEFTPSMVLAVFENLAKKNSKNHFTIGINDDLTNTSIDVRKQIVTLPKGTTECKFFGFGSDGTVSANKSSIKIIGENTNKYAQAYFEYDSKKAGGVTISHLRFGNSPIKATYLCTSADIIACHNANYVHKFDVLEGIKTGGTFLLNCPWSDKELSIELPAEMKRIISNRKLNFYVVDANKIARDVGMPGRINMVMQTAFFKLVDVIDTEKGIELIKTFAKKTYAKKGDAVIQMNMDAIDMAKYATKKVFVPKDWADTNRGFEPEEIKTCDFFEETVTPILNRKGDTLPVSAFSPNGEVETETSRFEKRGVANTLPKWIPENCIQCNQCSAVCPHAAIRPQLIKSGSAISKRIGAKPALGMKDLDFAISISPRDCTGCGNCVNVCPAKQKALQMTTAEEIDDKLNKTFKALELNKNPKQEVLTAKTVQFNKPLFEFSGACAGCGETPYIKLLTQVVGENLIIANATGCSSIFTGSFPTCPLAKTDTGKGPAWSNSLFEDNAEFGFGMLLAHENNVSVLENAIKNYMSTTKISVKLRKLLSNWVSGDRTEENSKKIISLTETEISNLKSEETDKFLSLILANESALTKKSFWLVGGDGWAYDIGFGGLDHVLSSNKNIKTLVLDTEVYSNTGGQCSKATPMGATAKFASSGKQTNKKDLAQIAMTYPNCYVATVSLGANIAQCTKAFEEAENHNGPAIIIAYAPCMNHGLKMTNTPEVEKNAVASGYVTLLRYNPTKSPALTLDPPFKTGNYQDFLNSETRFTNLKKINPVHAKELFDEAEKNATERLKKLKEMAKNNQ